jgi:hypothetical protein
MNLHSRSERSLRVGILIGCMSITSGVVFAQAGAAVSDDSPVFNAFRQLEKQTDGYRMHTEMQASDPRMARMMQSAGMGGMEKIVKGNTTQVSMHMMVPATDVRGQVDDWEIRAVVRDGKGARLITSSAVPRLLKEMDANLAMQMAMMERQAASVVAQAFAGPMGGISAAVAGASMAASMVQAVELKKEAHDFFKWKCLDNAPQQPTTKNTSLLSDLKKLGDVQLDGAPHTGYEFYVRDAQNRLQGPVRFYVAKDTGLPKRIEMTDPQGRGSMQMNYEYGAVPEIEIPECLAKTQ